MLRDDAHDAVHAVDAFEHAIALDPEFRRQFRLDVGRGQFEQPVTVVPIVGWKFR